MFALLLLCVIIPSDPIRSPTKAPMSDVIRPTATDREAVQHQLGAGHDEDHRGARLPPHHRRSSDETEACASGTEVSTVGRLVHCYSQLEGNLSGFQLPTVKRLQATTAGHS